MGLEPLVTGKALEQRKKSKATKKKHTGKDWAILNANDKFEIIGDDLRARGIID